MSPTDIVDCYLQSSAKTTGCVCLRQIAPASQPPVPRTSPRLESWPLVSQRLWWWWWWWWWWGWRRWYIYIQDEGDRVEPLKQTKVNIFHLKNVTTFFSSPETKCGRCLQEFWGFWRREECYAWLHNEGQNQWQGFFLTSRILRCSWWRKQETDHN